VLTISLPLRARISDTFFMSAVNLRALSYAISINSFLLVIQLFVFPTNFMG
jgi:hypothetical protein